MVSTTKLDRTEKLGITLPVKLLQKIDNIRGESLGANSFVERLRVS
jgi:hypothetical protein